MSTDSAEKVSDGKGNCHGGIRPGFDVLGTGLDGVDWSLPYCVNLVGSPLRSNVGAVRHTIDRIVNRRPPRRDGVSGVVGDAVNRRSCLFCYCVHRRIARHFCHFISLRHIQASRAGYLKPKNDKIAITITTNPTMYMILLPLFPSTVTSPTYH